VERLLIGLLANGHILLEGVPGLAKTMAVKTLAAAIHAKFQRIQFTPDLLPADLIGTLIYNQKDGKFQTKKGPIFSNFILADEINRSPAKVQSALLEAMQERQVTLGEETFPLDEPFLVLATQNPIEQGRGAADHAQQRGGNGRRCQKRCDDERYSQCARCLERNLHG
jgi:MoxR-like ATPase